MAINKYFGVKKIYPYMENLIRCRLHIQAELLKNGNVIFIDKYNKNIMKIRKFINPKTYEFVDDLVGHEIAVLVYKELNDNRIISIDNELVKIWAPATHGYTCESTYLSPLKDKYVNQIRELKNGTVVITTEHYSDDTFQVWDLNKSEDGEMIDARTFNDTKKTREQNPCSSVKAFKELSSGIACSTHRSGCINFWDFTKGGDDACVASCSLEGNLTLINELKNDALIVVNNYNSIKILIKNDSGYQHIQSLYLGYCGNVFSMGVLENESIVVNYTTGFMSVWTRNVGELYVCKQELKTLEPVLVIRLRAGGLLIINKHRIIETWNLDDNNKYIKEPVVEVDKNSSTNHVTHKAIAFYCFMDLSILDIVGKTYFMTNGLKSLIEFSEDQENEINEINEINEVRKNSVDRIGGDCR